ncbi:MAG: kelch repeat-containing protein [Kofleriaceae bacterium]
MAFRLLISAATVLPLVSACYSPQLGEGFRCDPDGACPTDFACVSGRCFRQRWTLRRPPVSPSARTNHAMAFDPVRGTTVLFGGLDGSGGVLDDTWEWNGTTWIERQPVTRPPARREHAMSYDSARQNIVLFGGRDAASGQFADTWEWDGTTWTLACTSCGPTARSGHVLAFDEERNATVMFGGDEILAGGAIQYFDDTWIWSGSSTSWQPSSAPTRPPARIFSAMAFDGGRRTVVLFGGFNADGELGDDWEWNGTEWIAITGGVVHPEPRHDHAMVYDADDDVLVMYGGYNGAYLDDTWQRDASGAWGQVGSMNPSRRAWHAMAYDRARHRIVLFGGWDQTMASPPLGDTWEY